MAKKKQDFNSLLQKTMGIVTKEDSKKEGSKGVELRAFAERWLYDSNIIRFGEIYQFAGDPGSGKSQHMFNLAAGFIRAGGVAEIIDTEHKSNPEASIIPNIGEDIYYGGRFGFSTAGSIDAVKAAKKGDDEAAQEQDKAWMVMLKERVDAIKASPELAAIPIFIGVDSMLGASTDESRDKYEAAGGSVGGRTATGMSRAAGLTEFLSNFVTDLAGTNITVAFTNHGKKKIAMGGKPSFGGPEIQIPGGESPTFHCSTILYFRKGGPVKKANVGGRSVGISVYKNSFGDDQRYMQVTFYYDILKDKDGKAVRDSDGNPMRRLLWDWDEAGAALLKRFSAPSSNDSKKEGVGDIKSLFPGITLTGSGDTSKVSCKKYGIDKITFREFGRLIMSNEELYQSMMEIPRITINHTTKDKIVVPDWTGSSQADIAEGDWDKDTDAEEYDEEALNTEITTAK